MSDPYEVLGVPRNASTDQIKAAYRELAKKYHPDNYANNPLADLAAEKMKEINDAYDQIVRGRQSGGQSSQGAGAQGYSTNATSASGQYNNVREMINNDRTAEAQSILDAVPAGRRDAEWFFLKGSIFFKNGWTNEAYTYFQTAVRMDQNNLEYRQALERLSWQMNNRSPFGQNYGGYNGYGNGSNSCGFCDLCAGMMCADCLCQGCGGC